MSSLAPVPPDPRLRLVLDPDDHVDHHRALRATADLSAGRVVCELKGGRQRPTVLAAAVLEGLGKDLDRRGNSNASALNWRRCITWLRAEGVTELIALRAQHLDWRGWGRMVELAAQADCGLTLVLSGCELDARRKRTVAQWPFERLNFECWMQRFGSAWQPSVASAGPVATAFPPVPDDDFTLFRAGCRSRLSKNDFSQVDACWRGAHARAADWLDQIPRVDEIGVCEHLREQVRSARSYGEVLATLRGTQAAFFCAGWLLKVDHERFAASALRQPYDLLTSETAILLRGFVPPRFAAVATLTLVLRASPHALTAMRLADIAPDGTTVRCSDREVPIPPAFLPFVVAQRAERIIDGGEPSSPLFRSPDGKVPRREQAPMTARSVQSTLRWVARETGLLVTTEFSARKDNDAANYWAHRRGVSVAPIIVRRPKQLTA